MNSVCSVVLRYLPKGIIVYSLTELLILKIIYKKV